MRIYKTVLIMASCLLLFSGCRSTDEIHESYYKDRVARMVLLMTDEDLAGQVFILSLRRDLNGKVIGSNTSTLEPSIEELITEIQPGGILLYGENLATVDETLHLNRGMQGLSRFPLWIATDEEGGIVSRLDFDEKIGNTSFKSNLEIAELEDPELAYQKGRIIGRELTALGINMNLAPIADIYTNNEKIGARAYGSDPELAARMVASETRGLQDEKVAAVLKHFPGHGDTFKDVITGLPSVNYTLDRLNSTEFKPFIAGIEESAVGIMVGHISVPKVTGDKLPATFSPVMLQDILRGDLGFKGLILSDSMATEGIADGVQGSNPIVDVFKAGIDMILFPPNPLEARDALVEALASGEITRERFEQSVEKILRIKLETGLWDTVIYKGCSRPEDSIGVVENREAVLPILAD